MTTIDFNNVSPDQLEMKREPRKSKFVLVHKESGTVAENPVTPGTHVEARFRRAQILPKENRQPDMIGYIEGKGDEKGLWAIIEGDNPRNEYLTAICADPDGLKISFEGPSTSTAPAGESPPQQPAEAPAPPPQEPTQPETPAEPAPTLEPEAPQEQPVPPAQPEQTAETPQPAPDAQPPAVQPEEPVGQQEADELDDILAGLEQ